MIIKHLTIKNNNLELGIYGLTKVSLNPPSTIWIKDKAYSFVSIESLGDQSNKSVQKDVDNTLARGILGGAILGSIRAIAGLIAGKNKVTGSDECIYKVNLSGGKFFVFTTSSPDIDFHSLIQDKSSHFNKPTESASNNVVQFSGPGEGIGYFGIERLRESALLHFNLSNEQLVQLMGNVEQQVKKIVAIQLSLNEDDIKNGASFEDDLGADELDKVEIIMGLEEYLGCEIPAEEDQLITTVQQAIDYVNLHIKSSVSNRA